MITAYHVVLEDVVDTAYPIRKKPTDESSDAAPILNANTHLVSPIIFNEVG